MKLLVNSYLPNKDYHLEEDVDLSNADFGRLFNPKKINKCHVDITINNYNDDLLVLNLKIITSLTLISCYSLEKFDQDYSFDETLTFSFDKNDEDADYIIDGPYLELDRYLIDTIITSLPTKIIKPGEKLPISKDTNIKIISDEELLKEKENKKDERWSKLDDIDVD